MSDTATAEWSIGELAAAAGVSARTLRHYDDEGLLSPTRRSDAGYRRYDARAVGRLYEIVALRRLGLSVAEIRDLLRDGGDGTSRLPSIAAQHLEAV
jgi:MerR family transcriptional regulator, thiopeptide resistance regulator